MDSLTQITLGAACGELVLGKKIGNRAMMWGAIGGTIPDLDVLANFMLTDVEALAFHRGISHSFFFAIISPFFFGWLTHRLYASGLYQKSWYKTLVLILTALFLLGVGLIVNVIPVVVAGRKDITKLLDDLESEDARAYAFAHRPSTAWRMAKIVCVRFDVYKTIQR